jgi:hypothetical protein
MSFCYIADNKRPSELFSQLKEILGEEDAHNVYMSTRTDEFIKWFGNWTGISKEMSSITPETIDYYKLLASNNNIIDKLDTNYEPKIFTIKSKHYFKNNKNQLQSIDNIIGKNNADTKAYGKEEAFKVLNEMFKKLNINPTIISKGSLVNPDTLSVNPSKVSLNTRIKDLIPILLKSSEISSIKYPKTYLNEVNFNDNHKKVLYLQNEIESKSDTFKSLIEHILKRVSASIGKEVTLNTRLRDISDEEHTLNYSGDTQTTTNSKTIENVKLISDISSLVVFDNSPTDKNNVYTGKAIKNHTYKYKDDLLSSIPLSVSGIKGEVNPNYKFNEVEVIENIIKNDTRYKEYFDTINDFDKELFQLFKDAIFSNDINLIFEKRPDLELDSDFNFMFNKIVGYKKDWAWRAEVGTEHHELFQAFVKEPTNRSDEENALIEENAILLNNKLNGNKNTLLDDEKINLAVIEQTLLNNKDKDSLKEELDNLLSNDIIDINIEKLGYKETFDILTKVKELLNSYQDSYSNTTHDWKAVKSYKSFFIPRYTKILNEKSTLEAKAKIIEKAIEFRNTIVSKGGYIMTEVVVHNDSLVFKGNITSIAGSIDILAVYPDGVEIYDIKTKKGYLSNNAEMFVVQNGKEQGYDRNSQGEHSLQVLAYTKMLEQMTDLKVKGAGIIHLTIQKLHINDDSAEPIVAEVVNDNIVNYAYKIGEPIAKNRLFDNPIVINITKLDGWAANKRKIDEMFGKTAEANENNFTEVPIDNILDKSELTKLIEQIKLSLESQLKRLKQTKNDADILKLISEKELELSTTTDKTRTKELQKEIKEYKKNTVKAIATRIKKLQNEIDEYNGFEQVALYIDTSFEEFYGNKENPYGYLRQFELIRDSYNNGSMNLDKASEELDSMRRNLLSYNMLDTIDQYIKSDSNLTERLSNEHNDAYIKLQKSLAAKTSILKNYNDLMIGILAKKMNEFVNENANNTALDLKAIWENEYTEKIKNLNTKLNQKLANGEDVKKTREAILKLEQEKAKFDKTYNSKFYLTTESITETLTNLGEDIGGFERLFISASSSSDTIMALFMTMLRWKLDDSDRKIKDIEFNLSKAIEDFQKFDKSNLFNKVDSNDYYKFMLEDITDWVSEEYQKDDGTTGTRKVMKKSHSFISPFGKKKFTLIVEGEEQPGEYTHDVIIKNYQHRLNTLRQEGKNKAFRKLNKEFKKWFDDNMEKEYTPAYHEMDSIRKDYTLDALELIDEQIRDIKDIAREDKRGEFSLTDEENDAIKKLNQERKELGSKYDDLGNLKTGTALKIAEEITEYNKLFNERHTFEQSDAKFEASRKQAYIRFKNEPLKYAKWLEDNTDYNINNDFKARVARLRMNKAMFDFGSIHKHSDILAELISPEVLALNDIQYVEHFNNLLDTKGYRKEYDSSKVNTEDIYKQINDITKPYKNGNTYNFNAISIEKYEKLKELEQEKLDRFSDIEKWSHNDILRIFGSTDAFDEYLRRSRDLRDEIDNLVDYPLRLEYKKIFGENGELIDSDNTITIGDYNYTIREFYDMTHIVTEDKDGFETSVTPIQLFTQMLPTNRKYKMSIDYDIAKEKELNKLKKAKPGKSDEAYDKFLLNTSWYKDNHKNNGEPNDKYRTIIDTDNEWIDNVYTARYSQPTVKAEYIREDDIRDNKGYLLPLKSKWINPAYEKLKQNPTQFKLYESLLGEYMKAQENHPILYRLGYKLPYINKNAKEIWRGGEKLKAITTTLDRNFSNFLVEDKLQGDYTKESTNIDTKTLPVHFVQFQDFNDVSTDVLSSVIQFMKNAERYGTLDSILATTRNLHSVIKTRDANGVNDANIDGESNALKMFNKTIMMQFFNEQSQAIEKVIPGLGYKIRLDKVADNVMMLTAMSQLGGLPWQMATFAKGLANGLQANMQLGLEAWANDYYTLNSWAKARFRMSTKGHKDLMNDFGKITRTSFTGQLFDAYDPMVGDFFDKSGVEVNKSRLNKLMNTDVFMMNQYGGELDASLVSMYTALGSHKVVNKQVYSLEQYLNMRSKQDNKELVNSYIDKLTSEFNALPVSLLDCYKIDEKTGKLSIDSTKTDFKMGSKQDKQIKDRLHAVNKELNGAYARIDKTAAETTVLGRLFMMYKKYIVPSVRKRFGSMQRNEELGDIKEGYLRTFTRNAFNDLKSVAGRLFGKPEWVQNKWGNNFNYLFGIVPGSKTRDKINKEELKRLKRAHRELGMILAVTLLLGALAPDDDEDKGNISGWRWFMLYEVERLRKEMNGLILITPSSLDDNWRQIKSPLAVFGGIQRVNTFLMQGVSDITNIVTGNPMDTYKQDSGTNEKGDLKLTNKFLKIFGNLGSTPIWNTDDVENAKEMRQMYDNLNMTR